MAVYKVLQDIEAEDKLLGPLTLKGFIYACTAGVLIFVNFKLLITGSSSFKWLLILVFLPPTLLFIVLASPLGREQPTEVWLLARVRFLLKPRNRVWNQTGISKLVTITAPKKIEKQRTKGFSEYDVQNRLQTLAVTLDSRGWAIKNIRLPTATADDSDRLVTPTTLPNVALDLDIQPSDDILDEQNNPTAQNFTAIIDQAEAARKLEIANRMNAARQEAAKPMPAKAAPSKVMTDRERADKLELARSGNALSVAAVAKLANRNPTEVVIQLH